MSYGPPTPDAGRALATKAVATAISYIPIVGPVLATFASPIVDLVSGIGTDQRKLFEDWERAYLTAGPRVYRTEPTTSTARKRNQARMLLIRILTQLAKARSRR